MSVTSSEIGLFLYLTIMWGLGCGLHYCSTRHKRIKAGGNIRLLFGYFGERKDLVVQGLIIQVAGYIALAFALFFKFNSSLDSILMTWLIVLHTVAMGLGNLLIET